MFVLASYDIKDNKRRGKVANTLKNYGERVQYSVFECILDRDKLRRMIEAINKVIDKKEDSVRIYQFCDVCSRKIRVCGIGKIAEDEKMFIV